MERLRFRIDGGRLRGAMARYDVLTRLSASAERVGVVPIAFGLGEDSVRVLLDGDEHAAREALRYLKVGTSRALRNVGLPVTCSETAAAPLGDLSEAIAWCHRAPLEGNADPLSTPWSSHRDLLGYRAASFFDARVVRRRVDPLVVHELAGGAGKPPGWPPLGPKREELDYLLRLAGAVRGVLPSDRSCFRLFVHLARARRWLTKDVAEALTLSTRRVRQLGAEREPALETALACLAHPALRVVP